MQVAAAFVMSPPIRNKEHQDGLKAAVAGGVLDIIATDHCPFNSTQKRMGIHDFRSIPNGVNGIEERMHIAWDTLVNTGKAHILSTRQPALASGHKAAVMHAVHGAVRL